MFLTIHNSLRKIISFTQKRAVVLAYHRVFTPETDPQLLCVIPEYFSQHLEVIRKYYNPFRLVDLSDCIKKKSIPDKSIILTFDDGYIDNLVYAKPLLEKYAVPATVFVTTGMIGQKKELWWDELERIILLPLKLPKRCLLTCDNQTYVWDLSDDVGGLSNYPSWNVIQQKLPCNRFKMYKDLHCILKPLCEQKRQKALVALRESLEQSEACRNYYNVCSEAEIRSLAGGMIDVGSHTMSHSVLSWCDDQALAYEILESKQQLEKILGSVVTSFSYPYGGISDIGEQSPIKVCSSGYSVAVANYSNFVTNRSNRFVLPRFLVRNWDGKEFAEKLEQWFNS